MINKEVSRLFQRKKLRKEYDQRLIRLMDDTKNDWFQEQSLVKLSYEENEELRCRTLLAKSKYFFLFREARARKISVIR